MLIKEILKLTVCGCKEMSGFKLLINAKYTQFIVTDMFTKKLLFHSFQSFLIGAHFLHAGEGVVLMVPNTKPEIVSAMEYMFKIKYVSNILM